MEEEAPKADMIEALREKTKGERHEPPQDELFKFVLPERQFQSENVKQERDRAKLTNIRQIVFLMDGAVYVEVYEKLQAFKTAGETNSDCLLRLLRGL